VETPDAVLANLRASLEPAGWRLSLVDTAAFFSVEFEHPLSTPFTASFRRDASNHSEAVARLLARHEFSAVAAAPPIMANLGLIRNLRAAAAQRAWDASVLIDIASILYQDGVLSEEEADWLAAAGASWSES